MESPGEDPLDKGSPDGEIPDKELDDLADEIYKSFCVFGAGLGHLSSDDRLDIIDDWNTKIRKTYPEEAFLKFEEKCYNEVVESRDGEPIPIDWVHPGLDLEVMKDKPFVQLTYDSSRLTKPLDREELYSQVNHYFPSMAMDDGWKCDTCMNEHEIDISRYRCQECFDVDVCVSCYQTNLPEQCQHKWTNYELIK